MTIGDAVLLGLLVALFLVTLWFRVRRFWGWDKKVVLSEKPTLTSSCDDPLCICRQRIGESCDHRWEGTRK